MFINNNYLTDRADGCIHCAMNANEISPKANARMNRIQKVSTFLRTFFFVSALIFWISGIMFVVISIWNPHEHPDSQRFLFFGYAVECCFAYKLFSFYAHGDLFAPNVVRCIRWIGIITVLIGIGSIFYKFSILLGTGWFIGASSAMGIIGCLHMIFFQLFFNLLPGFAIIFVAWIMDEGRKIQEEQELTV